MSEVCRTGCLFSYFSADAAEEFSVLQVFQAENRQAEYLFSTESKGYLAFLFLKNLSSVRRFDS